MSAEVHLSFRCPSCGGHHPRAECLAVSTMAGLDARQLQRLRRSVEHEVAVAVRDGLSPVEPLALLRAVESRLHRLGESDARPTLARRQRIAAERSTGKARA